MLLIVLATGAFLVLLCGLHLSATSGGRPRPRVQPTPMDRHTSSASIADGPHASSSLARHLLSTATDTPAVAPTPPAGFYDARTPGERAKARNVWSPFRSAEDKLARYAQWEAEVQQLVDLHRDARVVLEKYLEPAVGHLRLDAAPLYATNRTVVLLEGRTDPTYILLLKHMFHLLGPGWGLLIFHNAANMDWWVAELEIRPGGGGEFVELQRVEPIAFQQANALPTSQAFFDRLPTAIETILICQSDTAMLRSEYWPSAVHAGPSLTSLLDRFVYLGAPWLWCDASKAWCHHGGNGGLSARSRTAMVDLVRELRCTDWECHWVEMFAEGAQQQANKWLHVEDTFLAHQLEAHRYKYDGNTTGTPSRLADMERDAAWFALEERDYPQVHPWFLHKFWEYHSHLRWAPMIAHTRQYYPEVWMTQEELAVLREEMQ